MPKKDDLGDRMKLYEFTETSRQFDSKLPVYARIDGRGFSQFTRSMEKPFDIKMTKTMIEVTKYLVEKTHASIGYVQSDEISLAWPGDNENNKLFFAGKIQKQCSVLASMAAAKFALSYYYNFNEISLDCPHFDCRVIQLPSDTETANMFLWRAIDARKNAVNTIARHYFSHNELQHRSSSEMKEMLENNGISMLDYPTAFTHGTWIKRSVEERLLNDDEYLKIPEKHRPPKNSLLIRSVIKELDITDFSNIINRTEVIFSNETPMCEN